ncbi:hypothetical protein ACGFZP_07010 [Kitasatospora sp. NPDC048239]|uniref:hypothetical protein n=1 Tax=Kitasatospora sp. NPDC048239 TaxID=3364046 RepID=UPI003722A9E9
MAGVGPVCAECRTAPAVIEDLDLQPPRPWCLACALVLMKVGEPVTSYRELDGGGAYTRALAGTGTTQTLRFG